MRGIIGVLAAFSAISVAMNVAQVTAGNACDVTEKAWRNAVDQCSCPHAGCQLVFDNQRYQESWSYAMFGLLYSWFLVVFGLWISWTKNQTLSNSRITDTSVDNSIACKEAATSECRDAVKQWARAYREAPNAADPMCHEEDPNYLASQRAEENCRVGNGYGPDRSHGSKIVTGSKILTMVITGLTLTLKNWTILAWKYT